MHSMILKTNIGKKFSIFVKRYQNRNRTEQATEIFIRRSTTTPSKLVIAEGLIGVFSH